MRFTGMTCALDALGQSIERQLKEDNCVCAACSSAYLTLYRSVEKDDTTTPYQFRVKNKLDKYWELLKKSNSKNEKKKVE